MVVGNMASQGGQTRYFQGPCRPGNSVQATMALQGLGFLLTVLFARPAITKYYDWGA